MQKREKILAAAVGLLMLWFVGDWVVTAVVSKPKDKLQKNIVSLERKIEGYEESISRGMEAGKKLAEWQKQSLPSDIEKARATYRDWLLELVRTRGIEDGNVDVKGGSGKSGVYYRLPATVRGRGTLEQITTFLHDFYRAVHLHQITSLSITPVANSQQLTLSLGIESLILPGADRTDQLAEGRSTRLASDSLADYLQVIAERNLFGDGGIGVDPADYTFLSGINSINDVQEAWFQIRLTREVLKLKVGQRFEVGDFQGTVVEIDDRDVVIDSDGERWLLTLGEPLSQATALPPEF